MLTPAEIARLNMGPIVDRAAATLPATTTAAIYTITGWVDITVLYGVCTTVCSGTGTNLSIVHVPSSPASVNTTIAGVLAITSFDAGSIVAAELDGTALVGADGAAGAALAVNARFRAGPGSISLTTSATNTGAFRWVVRYLPVESGATIVAA